MKQKEREIKKLEKQLENVLKRRRKILDKALLSGISAQDYLELLLYDRMPVHREEAERALRSVMENETNR